MHLCTLYWECAQTYVLGTLYLDLDGNADSNRSGGKNFLVQIVPGNFGGKAARFISCQKKWDGVEEENLWIIFRCLGFLVLFGSKRAGLMVVEEHMWSNARRVVTWSWEDILSRQDVEQRVLVAWLTSREVFGGGKICRQNWGEVCRGRRERGERWQREREREQRF